jgi:hypothetical protein
MNIIYKNRIMMNFVRNLIYILQRQPTGKMDSFSRVIEIVSLMKLHSYANEHSPITKGILNC